MHGRAAATRRKKALYIVDLDDPWEAVKTLHQQSKFEVPVPPSISSLRGRYVIALCFLPLLATR